MQNSLDEEIKIAERNKYLAETEKVNAEKDKILFELQEAKSESQKNWWQSSKVKQNIIPGLIGLSFLGFYINYAVLPAFQAENLRLNLDNEKVGALLYKKEQKLFADSVRLKRGIKFNDSLTKLIILQTAELENAKKTIDTISTNLKSALVKNKFNEESSAQARKLISSLQQKLSSQIVSINSQEKDVDNLKKTRFKVSLGIQPDYSFAADGVKVDGTVSGRPGEVAGIKAGDIVIALGKFKVTDMQSYMEALSNFAPEDVTVITIMRNDQKIQLPVTFL